MADWLNIAGGAGKGYVEGQQDLQRKAEFDFMQNQRARQIKQQQLDDESAATLAKVRPAGTYTDETATPQGYETEPGFVGPPSKIEKKTTTVTAADAERARAEIMARRGTLPALQAAATLRQNAYQAQQQDRQEKQAQLYDAILAARRMNLPSNEDKTFTHMQQNYDLHPDGNRLVQQDINGVPMMSIVGPDGVKLLRPWVPRTKENMDKMLDESMSLVSPDAYWKGQELGLKKGELAAHQTTAAAAETSAKAKADEVAYNTTGPGGQAHLKYMEDQGLYLDRHGRSLLMQAQARVAADKKLTPAQKAAELTDFYTPLIMQANPGMAPEQARVKAAQVAMRDPNAKEASDQLAGSDIVKIGGKYYRPGDKGKLEEVKLPVDAKALAGKVAGVLGAVDDERGSVTEPTSTFKSVPTPSVTARRTEAAPISSRELGDWVPQLGRNLGIATRNMTNRRTGETISMDEFNRRTSD